MNGARTSGGMKLKTVFAMLLAMFVAQGCAVYPNRDGLPFHFDKLVETKIKDARSHETVSSAIESVDAGYSEEEGFILNALEDSDPLPDKQIKDLDYNEKSGIDVLRLLLDDSSINLIYTGSNEGNVSLYGSVNAKNVSGTLAQVVEKMTSSLGMFYQYQDDVLRVFNDQDFIISLPLAISDDTYTGMANTVQSLGGFSINLDKINGCYGTARDRSTQPVGRRHSAASDTSVPNRISARIKR